MGTTGLSVGEDAMLDNSVRLKESERRRGCGVRQPEFHSSDDPGIKQSSSKEVSRVPMKVQGNLRITIHVDGHLGLLEFRAVEEINHDIILGMDFGVKWDLSLRFRAKQWKYGNHGEWHSFANDIEDSSPVIMAKCAGMTEMTTSEAERIKEIVGRLIRKPATEYHYTPHGTSHRADRLHANPPCPQTPIGSNVGDSTGSGSRDASSPGYREICECMVPRTRDPEEVGREIQVLYRLPGRECL